MEDREILDLYFRRDEDAIVCTREKYGGYCHRIALNILSLREDAEESVSAPAPINFADGLSVAGAVKLVPSRTSRSPVKSAPSRSPMPSVAMTCPLPTTVHCAPSGTVSSSIGVKSFERYALAMPNV